MKLLLLVSFVAPTLALMMGYTESAVNLNEPTPPILPSREVVVYKVKEYQIPASDVVITVNSFPFDVGGSRPYQISAHGKKYRLKPEDVKEILSKGIQMDIPSEPLPTGTWIGPFQVDGEFPQQPELRPLNIN